MKKRKIKYLRLAAIVAATTAIIYAGLYITAYSMLYIAENHHQILTNYEVSR